MKLPSKIAVPDSREAVTAEVKRLLQAADVNGRLPTPREDILTCADLVESGELDLDAYKQSFKKRATGLLHKAIGKIFGFLDQRTRVVYVDPKIHPSKRNFVTYHEVTHKILDWQRVIYTEDEHSTLTPACRDIFESEANFGAAELLFQCEKFENMAKDYNISVASVLDLANRFDASIHATMRRFVERHSEPCLLLVLKRTSLLHEDGLHSYVVCYSVASSHFLMMFGDPFSRPFINPGNRLCDILNTGRSGMLSLRDINGAQYDYIVDVFDSTYRFFCLIYPATQKRPRVRAEFFN